MKMREYMKKHFLHFNARETRDAAQAWVDHLDAGGSMMVTLGGAMSTAELGIQLSRMIRQGKVHAITCTGANLEEDVFNLVAHDEYRVIPNYRDLSPDDETALYEKGFNRVTDTCIPESVIRHVERRLMETWTESDRKGLRKTPWEYMRDVVREDALKQYYQVPADHSWVLAAHEKNIPVFVPGWEDSTTGNIFAGRCIEGKIRNPALVKTGTEQMQLLAEWYLGQAARKQSVGFFQIGGGIAGDFPICVVPMLIQDLEKEETPFWGYFCQISDSTTSFGSYSGAVPNEKITWGKLNRNTPRFMINSDASVIAPLIFSYVLDE
jgi:deoxyhypusine synthase